MDDKNWTNFAKNIVKFVLSEVIRQSAHYVDETTESFTENLRLNVNQGYAGPFMCCTTEIWQQIELFSKQNQIWLADYESGNQSLLDWAGDY